MGSTSSKLHTAALEANLRVLKKLVEKQGVDVETEFGAADCATSEQYNTSTSTLVVVRVLHVAARHGYVRHEKPCFFFCNHVFLGTSAGTRLVLLGRENDPLSCIVLN